MGIDLNTVEEEEEEAKEEDAGPVCLELWHACAGPAVSLPNKGNFVVYFPQGHAEQLGDFYGGDVGNGRFDVPPHVFCRVVHVRLHVSFLSRWKYLCSFCVISLFIYLSFVIDLL